MKKLISLLLCLVMILSVMTACGGKDDGGSNNGGSNDDGSKAPAKTGIVDTWTATLKLSEYGDMGDLGEMEEYIDVDKLSITVTLKFDKNGEYELAVDDKSIDKLVDVMCDGMEDYLKDMAKEFGMSYNEMLEMMGASSIREFLEDQGLMDDFEDLKDMNESGEYTWEDGVLTIDGDEVDAELKGNTLTLEIEGMEVDFTRK